MSDYFICTICEHVFPNSEQAPEANHLTCIDCFKPNEQFYSSFGGEQK